MRSEANRTGGMAASLCRAAYGVRPACRRFWCGVWTRERWGVVRPEGTGGRPCWEMVAGGVGGHERERAVGGGKGANRTDQKREQAPRTPHASRDGFAWCSSDVRECRLADCPSACQSV